MSSSRQNGLKNNLDPNIVGDTAAVATSFLWTISSLYFTSAAKKIGSLSVNAYRIILAVAFLALAHVFLLNSILPIATNEQWFWMGISGVIGLGIGDYGLFAAYVMIGPRRSVLVMALAPIFASIGAYLMLGEILPTLATVGIAITLTGVALVILEEEGSSGEYPVSKEQKIYGIFFALLGAAGQGVGLVLAKRGIDLEPGMTLNPLSAALIRLISGTLFIWIITLAAGKFPELRAAIKSRDGINCTIAGSFFGPFMGVTLSMVAVTYTQTGVAQTLMSLMPVLIIPALLILYKQRTSGQGIVGAAITVCGVAILFLT
jgi:drug/metabolite transporter (DMT)-like permease